MASFRRRKPIFTSILRSMCQVGTNNILHLIPLRKSLLTFSPCVDPVPLLWTKLISRNYEACISQIIVWNADPFGQDVEHFLMDNILKYGDDPTVNQRDQASTTNWITVFLSLSKSLFTNLSLYKDWNPDQTISKWHQIHYLVFQYDDIISQLTKKKS